MRHGGALGYVAILSQGEVVNLFIASAWSKKEKKKGLHDGKCEIVFEMC